MTGKSSHITFLGFPLCQSPEEMEKHDITCSQSSMIAAMEIVKKLRALPPRAWGFGFRACTGKCPVEVKE